MPDFAAILGGASLDQASSPGTSAGITLAAGGTTHTKGAWTQLIASLTAPAAWLLIEAAKTNSVATYLFDIAIGASTQEVVLVADLHQEVLVGSVMQGKYWLFPLGIPAGTRLAARCQASVASATMAIGVHPIAPGMINASSLGQVETIGVDAANSRGQNVDPGAVAHTDSAWVELSAGTAFTYKWMCLNVAHIGANSANPLWLVDIGIGAAGSEKVLIADLAIGAGSASDAATPGVICFPTHVPAGTRVAVRARCDIGTDTNRDLYIHAHGVG